MNLQWHYHGLRYRFWYALYKIAGHKSADAAWEQHQSYTHSDTDRS